MEFFVKNDTSRPKALRSAVNGEMVIVPARSEDVYDLAETGHPDVPGLYIGPVPDEAEEPAAAAPKKAKVAPQPAPVAAPAPQPAPEPSPAAPAVTEAGPAPWQKGLAGQ
ncbi:MAG: hypothetical protein M0R28_20185 [Pigmentiphaga sp.]|nr:hypothetical protein [Pigmentiphaga sp.]